MKTPKTTQKWGRLHTNNQYQKAMTRFDEIFHARKGSPFSEEADLLSVLVRDYEDRNHPTPQLVHVVEYRDFQGADLAFLGSSLKNCIKFMKENTDFNRIHGNWHWTYYSQFMDNADMDVHRLSHYSKSVRKLRKQPIYKLHGKSK